MAVTFLIPSALRPLTDNRHAVAAEGATVAAAIASLVAAYPKLGGSLLASPEKLQPFVHVFLNGKDVGALGGLNAPVPDGAELLILQAISGG